jgi:transcriptional regulator with XRE-family HTH domain
MQETVQGTKVPGLTFADRLLICRRHAAISQAELADRIGRSLKSINNWEIGAWTPSRAQDVDRLARALDVDVDWLDPGAAIRNKWSTESAA